MENWCIIGDFNGVRKLEEIIGGEGVNGIEGRGEIRDFNKFIEYIKVDCLPFDWKEIHLV